MASIKVPAGKELRLATSKGNITGNVPLVLENEISISLSSSFKPLYGGGSNPLIDMLGNLSQGLVGLGFSSQFKEFGYQVWDKTDPLSINVTVTFRLGMLNLFSAREEVYIPMIKLASIPLPTVGGSLAEGTLENLVAPGPPPTTLLEGQDGEGFGYVGKYRKISLEIGNILRVDKVIVLKATPTVSTETDSAGYPIWAKVDMDIQSVETATVEMLQKVHPELFANNS